MFCMLLFLPQLIEWHVIVSILERTTALLIDMLQRDEQLQHMKKEVNISLITREGSEWLLMCHPDRVPPLSRIRNVLLKLMHHTKSKSKNSRIKSLNWRSKVLILKHSRKRPSSRQLNTIVYLKIVTPSSKSKQHYHHHVQIKEKLLLTCHEV